MTWAATQAKAQFSAVLDKAESEGPQVLERRKKRFILLTEEQYDSKTDTAKKPFRSAWDALAPSSGELFDVEFPRVPLKVRPVDFE
jgi:hypothetical protein